MHKQLNKEEILTNYIIIYKWVNSIYLASGLLFSGSFVAYHACTSKTRDARCEISNSFFCPLNAYFYGAFVIGKHPLGIIMHVLTLFLSKTTFEIRSSCYH